MRVEFDSHKTDRAAIEKRVRSLATDPCQRTAKEYLETASCSLACSPAFCCSSAGWVGAFGLPMPGQPGVLSRGVRVWRLDISRHASTRCASGIRHGLADGYGCDRRRRCWAILRKARCFVPIQPGPCARRTRARPRPPPPSARWPNLAPKTALARRNGQEVETPVEQLPAR